MSENSNPDSPQMTEPLGLFLRVFWMLLGNMALVICGLSIASNGKGFLSFADVAFGMLVPLMIVARYCDVAYYKGTTTYGEPATLSHWRRYSLVLLLVAAGSWIALHGIAYARS